VSCWLVATSSAVISLLASRAWSHAAPPSGVEDTLPGGEAAADAGVACAEGAEGAEGVGGVFETAASISESEATSPRSVAIVA
jgi:hypothetical protein